MQVFEENLDHFDPRNPYAGDEKLPVLFFMDAQKLDAESEEAGRPIFKDTECIKIWVSKDDIVVKPVDESHKRRWPRQYAAWKQTGANEPGMMGTPLSHFAAVSRAQVEELRYFKIFTVEQLAELSDGNAQKIPGITKLKQQAQAYIQIAKDQAPIAHLNQELAARDAKIAALEEKLNEVLAAQAEPRQPVKARAP